MTSETRAAGSAGSARRDWRRGDRGTRKVHGGHRAVTEASPRRGTVTAMECIPASWTPVACLCTFSLQTLHAGHSPRRQAMCALQCRRESGWSWLEVMHTAFGRSDRPPGVLTNGELANGGKVGTVKRVGSESATETQRARR